VALIAASAEPKAEQTARIVAEELGMSVVIDPRLGEVDRPTTWDGDYREQAAAHLAGKSLPQWEPRDEAIERFGDAIIDLASREGDGDIVVVNHGLALSLFLAANVDLDIVAFWQALRFPDAWRFVPATGEVTHVFADGLAPPDA
jgi:broad specificity phosphatase PhoE